jgi:hypothetical protein
MAKAVAGEDRHEMPPRARFSAIDLAGAPSATGRIWWQECTYRPSEEEYSWIGAFAVIVLGVAGIMRIFDAIWAFRSGR